jgi:hypothetical protein
VLLFLLVCSISYAQSQQPSPTPRENSNQVQEQAKSAPQQTATDQRGTEQSPIIVKIMESPKTQEEIQRDINERDEQTANNRKLTYFTGGLAFVALLQFIGIAIQAWFLRKSFIATKLAAEAAKTSADVAEKMLTLGERAYLVVDGFSKPTLGLGEKLQVKCSIINQGRTPATIIRIFENKVQIFDEIPHPPVYDTGMTIKRFVGTGFENRVPMDFMETDKITENEFEGIMRGKLKVFVYRKFNYTDIFGKTHETGFCAELQPYTREFFPPSNAEDYIFWT